MTTRLQRAVRNWLQRPSEPGFPLLTGRAEDRVASAWSVALVVVSGTMAAIVFHYVAGQYFGAKYPWNTFLFRPSDRFGDFWDVYRQSKAFRPGVSDNMVYSPFLHLVTGGLALLPVQAAFALVASLFGATLGAVAWRWLAGSVTPRIARALMTVIFVTMPYPVLFLVDRGNLDMLVFVTLAAFFYLYYERASRWAWLPLGLAIAAKYYWVTFLVLLLSDRHFRQAAYAALSAMAATFICLAGVAWSSGYRLADVIHSMRHTLVGHVDLANTLFAVRYGHTAWGALMTIDRWVSYHIQILPHVQLLYVIVALLFFAWVALRLTLGRYLPWQKATAIVVCTLLLQFENHDYTFIFLLLPLALFVSSGRPLARNKMVAVLFGLLMVPFHYYAFTFDGFHSDVAPSVLLYPVVMIVLVVTTLATGSRRVGPASASTELGAAP